MTELARVKALTFDLFGTVLDLGTSLKPYIADFLDDRDSAVDVEQFWAQWRGRQRLEQFQDSLMMVGHSGYLETARRAFVYTLALNSISTTPDDVTQFMTAWQQLSPFEEVRAALERLKSRYKLVVLSNGDPEFLAHLAANRVSWPFDDVISATSVGAFKPHPAVYRFASTRLGLEVGECLMVSANSFDVVGARACGFRAAYVNRYTMPYEDTPYRPDLVVDNFTGLADALLGN